jgi:hypothetical protein
MPNLSDARFDALRVKGYTGSISDMTLAWLQAEGGATAKDLPTAWIQMLANQGFATGDRNTDWFDFLRANGYWLCGCPARHGVRLLGSRR